MKWNKILSLLLVLVMLLGILPAGVMAAEAETEEEETVINLDFNADANKGKALTAFTVEEDGWEYDADASHGVSPVFFRYASGTDTSTHWDYSCFRLTLTDYGGTGVLNFAVPEAGKYVMELTYCYGGPGHYTDVTIGDSVTQYFGWSPWGTAPATVTNQSVELVEGVNSIKLALREDIERNDCYIMVKQIVFTKAPEPTSGLVIDLQAAANDEAALSTYAVTGSNITEHGWGINTDETDPGKNPAQTFKYYAVKGGTSQTPTMEDGTIPGVYFYTPAANYGITINFYVPEDGYYRPDMTAISNMRCGKAEFWVDGTFAGSYSGYGEDTPEFTVHNLNTVKLEKGVHKLQIKCLEPSPRFSTYYWIYLNKVEFVKVDAAQQVAEVLLTTKKENFYLQDSVAFTVEGFDADGNMIHLGTHADGTANWSIVSSDPETLKIEEGRLVALKEGTVDITATVKLAESEKSYTKTITVEDEPEAADFEIRFDEDVRQGRIPNQFTLEDDGWRFVSGTGSWFSAWADEITYYGKYMGIVTKQMNTYDQSQYLTFEVKAPATGDYRVDIHHIMRSVCGDVKVYFDGEYIGAYNGNGTNWELAQDSLSAVHMERNQVYRLTFCGQIPVGSDNVYMFLHKIAFVVDEIKETPVNEVVVSVDRVTMAVGEDCTYTFAAFDGEKHNLPIDHPLDGYTSKYLTVSVSDPSVVKVEGDTIYALKPGTASITVTVTCGGQTRSATKSIEINSDVLTNVSFYLETDRLVAGETAQTGITASTNSGYKLDLRNLQIVYETSDETVATIDENGLVTAVGEGEVLLTATVSMAGNSATANISLTISPKTGKITVSNPEGAMSVHPDDTDGIELLITGVDAEGNELDMTNAEISYSVGTAGVVEIKDGRALPIALGSTTLLVTATMPDGTVYETSTWISVNQGKVSSTYYTEEKRAAAQYNVLNYAWASDLAKEATTKADWVVENLDAFYDIIPFEGIPRADNIGMNEDPMQNVCPVCGVDTLGEYGHYSWITDPLNDPWKIKCPACKSRFPSNDFESYYKSGLDDRGVFHQEDADPQYLVNELYPEKGAGWGVDDGWGWVTGETYTNRNGGQSPRIYAFVAYFNANGLWNGFYSNASNNVRMAIRSLTDAYLYTGDIKYGRAGAILIDRIADIYPTMSLTDHVYKKPRSYIFSMTVSMLPEGSRAFTNNEGTYYTGKILGNISEGNFLAKDFIKAYDAFYPAFDDPEVVAYLADRAEQQGLVVNGENPKDTPQELRQNGIDGILHEVSEGVRNADIRGNFGMAQASMAMAAVVLDSTEYLSEPVDEPADMPTGDRRKMNSNEMVAWLYEVGPYSQNHMFNKIITSISRDGHGDEVSPSYHTSWIVNLVEYADAMEGYTGYPGADLYENPKFIKMLVGNLYLTAGGNTTLQNGDSGSAGGVSIEMNKNALARAFRATGNVELAQALYFLNGETTEGLAGDIFDPDAARLGFRVQAIIDEYGAYDVNSSVLLPGYGQALLKYGNKNDSNEGLYSLWFGRIAGAHGNRNALDINIFAYGLNMAPSLGYPRAANSDLIRAVWERGTISRNTVIVDDTSQENFSYLAQYANSEPYHFEDAGRVKVMDAEAAEAYGGLADEYRRTIVAVQGDDDAYYAVDFFHVIGGSTHLYSYHAASLEYPESDGVETVPQNGGSYAGEDVAYGSDVDNGYSFLYDVETDHDPANNFYLDYTIYDHNHLLVDGHGLHLRLNMLSTEDEPFTEVTYAKGHPPIKESNPDYYPYSLIRKDGSDSLFTAVHEPYRYDRYLKTMELVEVEVISGTLLANDRAAAVKVYRTDGKVEYIVYCTNYDAVLRVDDRFEFSGFVGVVTYESTDANANICYRYGMDATIVAGPLQEHRAITGKVVDFTRDLSYENFMAVTVNQDIDPEALVGRVIYVENDGEENAAYIIKGVSVDGSNVILDLGDQHLVRSLKDPSDVLGGYNSNIAVGQSYCIPMSVSEDVTTIINYVPDQVVKAGNKLSVTVGVAGSGMTYEAEGLVSGMKLNASTGALTWTTSKTQTGRYPITVKAINAEGDVLGARSFVIYVVSYTGSTYDASVCAHSKAVTYTVDGIIETVCPACGTVTKTAVEEEPAIEKFDLVGSNMTLGNELKLNFMANTTDIRDGYVAKITHNGEVTEATFGKYNTSYSYVTYTVAAAQMADTVSVEVFDADGNAVSNVYETSVRAYAMNMLGRNLSAKINTLLVDMLNYGAAAQNTFSYNTADLANSQLTDEQKALATESVACTDGRVKGTNYYGSNISLESKILLNVFFKNVTEDMYAEITFTDFGGTEQTVEVPFEEFKAYSGSVYGVVVDDIALAESFTLVTVTVYNADGTVHGTATDSVESYIARNAASDINEAIMKFAASAKAYYS